MINPSASNSDEPLPMQYVWGMEVKPEDDWEFYPEAIQAWRCWMIKDVGNGIYILHSISYKDVAWIPGQELVAQCIPQFEKDNTPGRHACPDLTHKCGIYSVLKEEQALQWRAAGRRTWPAEGLKVHGIVSIWGHVYKFTQGYLAELAYPSKLFIPTRYETLEIKANPEELADNLSTTYNIEVVTYDSSGS